ncbi:hypothetical protein U1Q18_032178 [Sarracenia purpurea var. burkii]
MAERKENIVIFPFMAQGHIISFLSLALELEKKKDYTITIVNTPLNITRLRCSIPPSSAIRLREIPFDSAAHGLPPNSETTETLPPLLMLRLIEASPSLQLPFRKLIADIVREHRRPPLCIISDMFFGWSAKVAHDFGIFHAIFNAAGGYGMAVFHSLWLNLPHKKLESGSEPEDFPIPGFPQGHQIQTKQLPDHLKAAGIGDSWYSFSQGMFRDWLESDGILFNTTEEIDGVGLEYYRRHLHLPVWPVGPILSSTGSKARAGDGAKSTSDLCTKWLDTKPENSVLYVAFGSQSSPSPSQNLQLAMALESSGKNFIWVIRRPLLAESSPHTTTTADHEGDREWLPRGFERRIRGGNRGLLLEQWAPQLEILSHKSIGAFLSHCGWNSVLEALINGVPILSWPMGAEQHFNAKMLEEELGVCVGVAAGGSCCEVREEDMVEKIEMVMNGTSKGKEMRRKAGEVREMMEKARKDENGLKGSSTSAMDEFLHAATLYKSRNGT